MKLFIRTVQILHRKFVSMVFVAKKTEQIEEKQVTWENIRGGAEKVIFEKNNKKKSRSFSIFSQEKSHQ